VALAARDLRAREAEVVAERLREGAADGRLERLDDAVDAELRQARSPP
jgi:hypothetical protein